MFFHCDNFLPAAAQDACISRGYEVAIATAGCSPSFARNCLSTRVDPPVWNMARLYSPAFQACQPDKSQSIEAIDSFFGLRGNEGCSVLIDNDSGACCCSVAYSCVEYIMSSPPPDTVLAGPLEHLSVPAASIDSSIFLLPGAPQSTL